MYITILFLPFLAAILSGFFGRSIGVKGVHLLNITCLFITIILAFIAFYEVVLCNSPISVELFSRISIESFKISWSFYFDELTVSMLIPVLIVSLLVHVYSVGYMGEDPHQQRFFSYISLFTGLMLILISGDNFLVMFLGWEGVGVCSYLLVHFWFTRIEAVKSGMNAMFTNRIGDYFLTVGFFALFFTFGSLDYATIFSMAPYINSHVITFISLLLLVGAAAKSAQLGLHSWLPQAMEGFSRALFKFHYMREHSILFWSTQWIILFGKIQDKEQSARSFMKLNKEEINDKGSSKTIREINNNNIYSKKLKEEFIYWFIGFSEGDGSFSFYKDKYLEFKVTQSSRDAQILFYIKKELGFGNVSIQDKVNKTHQFRVRKKEAILKLIEIFNGNILTNYKDFQFQDWIKAYNKIYNDNIIYKGRNSSFNLNNNWLLGFTDAEGCFTVNITKSKKFNSIQVTVRYLLSQKGELELFNKIGLLLNGKVHYLKSYEDYNLTVHLTKLKTILEYLKVRKLKTKKLISYKNWLKVYNLVITKQHLKVSGLKKIEILRKNINKNKKFVI
jgi:hypothetical protein